MKETRLICTHSGKSRRTWIDRRGIFRKPTLYCIIQIVMKFVEKNFFRFRFHCWIESLRSASLSQLIISLNQRSFALQMNSIKSQFDRKYQHVNAKLSNRNQTFIVGKTFGFDEPFLLTFSCLGEALDGIEVECSWYMSNEITAECNVKEIN